MKKEYTNQEPYEGFFLNSSLYQSVNSDLKEMEFPIEFCKHMLSGLCMQGHDITGKHDEYTELRHPDDIIEFVFTQLTEWKDIEREEKSMQKKINEVAKHHKDKVTAQDILNKIREKHSDK